MTEQERINGEVQMRLTVHDEKFNSLIQSLADFKEESRREMADFKEEMRDFKQEMRDRDNQRHAEIAALRVDTNAKVTEIRNTLDSMDKHMRNQTIVTLLGIAAMVVAVLLK